MAKALLGHRVIRDDRLLREAARLRTRVRDLERLIEDLLADNDRLRAGGVDASTLATPLTAALGSVPDQELDPRLGAPPAGGGGA